MFAKMTMIRSLRAALAAALLVASFPAGVFAASHNKPPAPPVKEGKPLAPTGADCQKKALDAAEKSRKAGGTDSQQQAAYGRAKVNCQGKM